MNMQYNCVYYCDTSDTYLLNVSKRQLCGNRHGCRGYGYGVEGEMGDGRWEMWYVG
jgi:hypothetical protein